MGFRILGGLVLAAIILLSGLHAPVSSTFSGVSYSASSVSLVRTASTVALNSATPDPPTNVRVYSDPNRQVEPSLAVNPGDSMNIVIGYNDGTNPGTAMDPGVSRTGAGGGVGTWSYQGILSGGAPLAGGSDPCCDAALAFDSARTLYYVAITVNGGSPGEVYVRKSTDAGSTFPTMSVISSITGRTILMDKPSFAIDTSASPNRLYVAWTDFNFGNGAILFAWSNNGGSSWNLATNTVSGTRGVISDTLSCCTGSAIAIGPNGEVYVAYFNGASSSIRISVSTTNGVSFATVGQVVEPTVTQFPNLGLGRPQIPNTNLRTNSFPTIAADTSSSPARGAIYVAWADYRNANGDILIRKSTNMGGIWTAATKVNNDGGTADQFLPAMTVHPSNGKIFLIFYDRRDDLANTNFHLYYAYALPGAYPTFTNRRLTTAASDPRVLTGGYSNGGIGDYLGATVKPGPDDTFAVAWADLRDGSALSRDNNANIYFAIFNPDAVFAWPWLVVFQNPCWLLQLIGILCGPRIPNAAYLVHIPIQVQGTGDDVSLQVSGLPSGALGSFSQPSGVTPFSSVLTISASQGLPAGGYSFAVSATNKTQFQFAADSFFNITSGPFVVLDHLYAKGGDKVMIFGDGFTPQKALSLTFDNTPLSPPLTTNSTGQIDGSFSVPTNAPDGRHTLNADDMNGHSAQSILITPGAPSEDDDTVKTSAPISPALTVILGLLIAPVLILSKRHRYVAQP